MSGFTTLEVMSTDCTGSGKSNYQAITTTTAIYLGARKPNDLHRKAKVRKGHLKSRKGFLGSALSNIFLFIKTQVICNILIPENSL